MPDKQQILQSICALAKEMGRAPSRAEFLSRAGISIRRVLKWFPTWNDAIRAAGLRPYAANARISDRALLEDWAKAVRKHHSPPPRRAYQLHGKYNAHTLANRFGGWSNLPEAFRTLAEGQRKWADVLELLPLGTSDGPASKARRKHTNHNSALSLRPYKGWNVELKGRPAYGQPTQFPGFRHEPVDEQGVVLLFGMLAKDLGYVIENVHKAFPDCEAKRHIGPGRWQRVHIEFEFESKNYREHGHPVDGCDVIVCWRHNWPACPKHLEILELSTVITTLAPSPIHDRVLCSAVL